MTTEISEADQQFLAWEQKNPEWWYYDGFSTYYPSDPRQYHGPLYAWPPRIADDGIAISESGDQKRSKLNAAKAFGFNTPLVAQRLANEDINFETAIVLIDILAQQLLCPSFKDRVETRILWQSAADEDLTARYKVLFTYIDLLMKKAPPVEMRSYIVDRHYWLWDEKGKHVEKGTVFDCGRYIGDSVRGAARWEVRNGNPPLTDDMKQAMNGFVELAHRYGLGMNHKQPFPDLPYWLPDNVGPQSGVKGATSAPTPA